MLSQNVRVCLALVFGCFPYAIMLGAEASTGLYLVLGGLAGVIASVSVCIDIGVNSNESVMRMLLWKSFADFGIAIRFMFNPLFDVFICGSTGCTLILDPNDPHRYLHQENCGFVAAFHVFFQTASELWFFFSAIDLIRSLQDPFTSTKVRLRTYHMMVWGISFLFAMVTNLLPRAHTFWTEESAIDNTAVCWVNEAHASIYSVMLYYLPLGFIYSACIATLIFSYRRLRMGISQTVAHRVKALVINVINLGINLCYWLFISVFYLLSKSKVLGGNGSLFCFRTLLYFGAAKGLSSIITWILTKNLRYGREDVKDDEGVDLNFALRQEVMYYATKGIQSAVQSLQFSSRQMVHKERYTMKLEQSENEEIEDFAMTPRFVIRLILGYNEESQQIADIVQNKYVPEDKDLHLENFERSEQSPLHRSLLRKEDNADVESNEENQENHENLPSKASNIVPFRGSSQRTTNTQPFRNSRESSGVILRESGSKPAIRFLKKSQLRAGIKNSSVRALPVANEDLDINPTQENSIFREIIDTVKGLYEVSPDVYFVDFTPQAFRNIRESSGIKDEQFINYFKSTVKERVTQGGASGALFFFSKDEVFLAKSCSKREFENVIENSNCFANYFQSDEGRHSLISKIYGAYLLRIYSKDIYFIVMGNIFYHPKGIAIHETYDIKGSTHNRSSAPPAPGQSCTCKNCGQKFVYAKKRVKRFPIMNQLAPNGVTGASTGTSAIAMTESQRKNAFKLQREMSLGYINDANRCTFTVSGQHEPNIVMKDNDLKYKLRLSKAVAKDIMIQIHRDADFLYGVKVMDYSLLVGVHNAEFDLPTLHNSAAERSSMTSFGNTFGNVSNTNIHGSLNTYDDDISSTVSSTVMAPLGGESPSVPSVKSSAATSTADATNLTLNRVLNAGKVIAPRAYLIGIIDYQQKYNWVKKVERWFKTYVQRADPDGLSAMDVDRYKDRFVNHIREILDVDMNELDVNAAPVNPLYGMSSPPLPSYK